MSRTLALTLVALCASAPAFAQQAATTAAPARAPRAAINAQRGTTVTPVAQTPTPAPAAPRIDPGIDTTDANITIEITVVDKAAGTGATTTRQGTITVANQNSGSVRGLLSFYGGGGSAAKLDPTGLDIDAKTFLRKSGSVSAALTVAYVPAGMEPIMSSIQRQSATLFLKPGQETQVLTSGSMTGSGPAVKITAKATVVK
jgi:hypothetical protein